MLFGFEDSAGAEADRAAPAGPAPQDSGSPWWLLVALGLTAGLASAFALWALWPNGDQLTKADVDSAIAEALATQADSSAAGIAFEQIAPSFVVVRSFPSQQGQGALVGGGFVFNDRGEILTANHLLGQAEAIEVIFADGSTSGAQIISVDTTLDTAVLAALAPSSQLVPAVIANSRTVQVGDPVFATGNPLGLTASLSGGIISGLDRSIPLSNGSAETLSGLIQFDAAVNQGSAGGPLVNAQGHVIGMITVLAAQSDQGSFTGIGFAVPIDKAAGTAADGPSQ